MTEAGPIRPDELTLVLRQAGQALAGTGRAVRVCVGWRRMSGE